MRYVFDRIEGEYAILEDMETLAASEFKLAELPAEAQPGDVLIPSNGGFHIDSDETTRRKEAIQKLFESLWTKFK